MAGEIDTRVIEVGGIKYRVDLDPDHQAHPREYDRDAYPQEAIAEFDRSDWLDLARQCGIALDDGHGNLLPDVLEAISHTVSAAIWYDLTTGYLTLTDSYHIPRKFLAA